jgi:hypothetical protein
MHQQPTEAVVDELRTLIHDVRVWLDAMPMPGDQIWADITPAAHGAKPTPGEATSCVAEESRPHAELQRAVAVLAAQSDALSTVAERAAEAARARGDEIDAILAEIRRVRTETAAA